MHESRIKRKETMYHQTCPKLAYANDNAAFKIRKKSIKTTICIIEETEMRIGL